MARRISRIVRIGKIAMGGGAPISVQTMNRSPSGDIEGNLREIRAAEAAGADLTRLAVPNPDAAAAFGKIAARSPLPLIADTHFDWRTTLAAIREGAAKVRINPGNMNADGLARVAEAAGAKGIPIRIGGNSGSILRPGMGRTLPLAEIMAGEALAWAEKLEKLSFRDIAISVKANDAAGTVLANRLVAARSDYPLHLGVTAAGPRESSLLKSAAAIGSLLLDGIGDSIRFSFTGDSAGEIAAGRELLRSLGLRREGPEIISCPACGRAKVDLPELVRQAEERLRHIQTPLRIAIMGCEVNGPGEARDADLGLASAGGVLHLFIRGEVVEKAPPGRAIDRLIEEAEKMCGEANNPKA
jgi:(E)-4-hydroxy-3-methylbut-2-enyl-diphosphate synthase